MIPTPTMQRTAAQLRYTRRHEIERELATMRAELAAAMHLNEQLLNELTRLRRNNGNDADAPTAALPQPTPDPTPPPIPAATQPEVVNTEYLSGLGKFVNADTYTLPDPDSMDDRLTAARANPTAVRPDALGGLDTRQRLHARRTRRPFAVGRTANGNTEITQVTTEMYHQPRPGTHEAERGETLDTERLQRGIERVAHRANTGSVITPGSGETAVRQAIDDATYALFTYAKETGRA